MIDREIENKDLASFFNFTLSGPIQVVYQGKTISLARAKYKVLYDENGICALKLIAQLTPEGSQHLGKSISLIHSAMEEGYDTYLFEMKPPVLKRYHQELTDAVSPEAYLSAGQGICLQLEQFDCIGTARFDS